MRGVIWGDVPTWVQAVGTLAAFAAAGRAVYLQGANERDRGLDRRRAQAELVTVWLSDAVVDRPDVAPRNRRVTSMTLLNASASPVFDVRLEIRGEVDSEPHSLTLDYFGVLPPTTTHIEPIRASEQCLVNDGGKYLACASFKDATGRRWKRFSDGRLLEIAREKSA